MAKELLKLRMKHHLSLNEVAEICGIDVSPFSPLCNNPVGTTWNLVAGSARCEQSKLALQQTSNTFAELDLSQVNNNPFILTSYRVPATFQDPTSTFTYASLLEAMHPAKRSNSTVGNKTNRSGFNTIDE